jgi:hypothetical protein
VYRQSFNEFVGIPMNWQRFGVGLEITVSGKPNPLAERRRQQVERERKARRGEEIENDETPTARRGPSAPATTTP